MSFLGIPLCIVSSSVSCFYLHFQEFFDRNWTKKEASVLSPNVMKLTELSNRVSAFVAIDILFAPDEFIARAIAFYIRVNPQSYFKWALSIPLLRLPIGCMKNVICTIFTPFLALLIPRRCHASNYLG
jgi:hypothetical protein